MLQSTIVLPSWHLEDVTRDTNEKDAAAVLNAYALAFHPAVIAAAGSVATWKAAPSLENPQIDQIVIVPESSRAKVERSWFKQAEEAGTIVLFASADRTSTLEGLLEHPRLLELIQQKLNPSDENPPAYQIGESLLIDDFLALGVVFLLTSLLSQAMYHYDNVQETRFDELLIEAAKSSLKKEEPRTAEFFQQACEQLLESREKFYSVDAHLIDLCLLSAGMTAEDAQALCESEHTVNLLCTSEVLKKAISQSPEIGQALVQGVHSGKISIVGGEQSETPSPLLSLQSLRWQFEQGMQEYEELLETPAQVWGRMTFGLSTQLPMMLKKFGMNSAYHLVLDDGVYPDDEQSHFSWESRGGVTVQGISRIPLSVENASTVLKIPERLAEAMNHDHLACAVLARWPKIRNPWFFDLLRIQKYAPVLGKFNSLEQFFEETDNSGHSVGHEQRHYLSPNLDQLTGRDEADPIGRFQEFWKCQSLFSLWTYFSTTNQILNGKSNANSLQELESKLLKQSTKLNKSTLVELQAELRSKVQQECQDLAKLLSAKQEGKPGFVLFNPLSHAQNSVVRFALEQSNSVVPVVDGAVKHLQIDTDAAYAVVEFPACGFVAVPGQAASSAKPTRSKVPLAGEFFLQSEFYYAQIDPETGGLQRLRAQGATENLLSERVVYRLDGDGGNVARSSGQWSQGVAEPTYSRMVADSITTTKTGPVVGEIVVQGRLMDQDRELATFVKTYRSYRGRRNLEIKLSIEPKQMPSQLPDRSYYALRFAWSAAAAVVKGNLQQSEYIAGERRLESTGPIEIEDGDHRITLLPHHQPFHQRTGMRMMDSLLIVHGESAREFSYDIAVDAAHSAALSDELSQPIQVVPVNAVSNSKSAWLYHVSAPSVHLMEARPAMSEASSGPQYDFDFIETERRHANVRFALFRKPSKAWEVDFFGKILSELTIENDEIHFECLPCDYIRIRVLF
ncbi:MAG TPA: hypothetical protein DD473_11465 [Planctomycetaceae bacterium]|nr:hypothetical protein [Planctomycetaceae bacterium]